MKMSNYGYCFHCTLEAERFFEDKILFDQYMSDPYLNRINTEYYKENRISLTAMELSIFSEVRTLELSNKSELALEKFLFGKYKFSYQNSKTIWNEEYRIRKVIIDKLILCGRFEEAAVHYESLNMWKEAGDTRKLSRTVKNVNVDVNQLIDTVKYSGLGLQYKCHNCGASIKMNDGEVGNIKHCSYCGASVDTDAMMKILREAMR